MNQVLSRSAHSVRSTSETACHAVALPDGVPDWVHILPAGTFTGHDGRGPFKVTDAAALAKVSIARMGMFGVIDENHSTDLAAIEGRPAPARGFITGLEARADGVWARVDWNADGLRLIARKAYRGISPVIEHLKDGTVTAILRASLVNTPNFRALTALHQEETNMDFMSKLRAALGLPADASEEAILAKLGASSEEATAREALAASTALAAALAPVAAALSLNAGSDATAVLAGVEALKTQKALNAAEPVITALQAELKTTGDQLTALQASIAHDKAETFVGQAIRDGRAGVKPMRDRYVAMHAASAEGAKQVEELIGAMPKLNGALVMADLPTPSVFSTPAEALASIHAEIAKAAKDGRTISPAEAASLISG